MLAKLVGSIRRFLAPVPGAIAAHLNVEELLRIALVAASNAGLSAIPAALLAHAGQFVAPPDLVLATAVLTVLFEVLRRLPHGSHVLPASGTAPALRLFPLPA